jgi:hypothetical protein
VSRPEWNGGISIKRLNGSYTLMMGSHLLDEAGLAALLDAIGTP